MRHKRPFVDCVREESRCLTLAIAKDPGGNLMSPDDGLCQVQEVDRITPASLPQAI
jgi:hypothetical protein